MRKFIVLINQFVNTSTHTLQIGGVQTYIRDLSLLALNNGYKVIVYQNDSIKRKKCFDFEGISIVSEFFSDNQKKFSEIYEENNDSNTLFIISTDMMNVKSNKCNVISIQHGITFDIPGYMIPGFWRKNKFLQRVNKTIRNINNVRRFNSVRNTVCVDYNYFNWFRTQGTIESNKHVAVIPNYCSGQITEDELAQKLFKKRMVTKIVFARRFEEHRGTLLFANVAERLLNEYPDIEITFAGDGTYKEQIVERFENINRVHFTTYSASNSITFHKDYDIAVVPTIFSEGTSLSLCEAMAAGVFPICTYVGGMTNIVLDHYNGIMCYPSETALYLSIQEVLMMKKEDFDRICKNAYYSSTESFGREIWQNKWLKFMDEVMLSINQ